MIQRMDREKRISPTLTGCRLKWIMREKGFSVKEVQTALGLRSSQSIYRWLEGKSLPSVGNMIILSEIFGEKIDNLLGLIDKSEEGSL